MKGACVKGRRYSGHFADLEKLSPELITLGNEIVRRCADTCGGCVVRIACNDELSRWIESGDDGEMFPALLPEDGPWVMAGHLQFYDTEGERCATPINPDTAEVEPMNIDVSVSGGDVIASNADNCTYDGAYSELSIRIDDTPAPQTRVELLNDQLPFREESVLGSHVSEQDSSPTGMDLEDIDTADVDFLTGLLDQLTPEPLEDGLSGSGDEPGESVPSSQSHPHTGNPAAKSDAGERVNSRNRVRSKDSNEGIDPAEDLLRKYLSEIGEHPLLTKDDETRLAKLVEAGAAAEIILRDTAGLSADEVHIIKREVRRGKTAHQEFVLSNLRLVVSIAKRYQSSGMPLLDLIQEGNLGLMHAVGKFDWRKGFKFSTYSTWWIRQAITRGIANTGRTIRLPVHAGDTLARVVRSRGKLEAELGRGPTVEEVAQYLELDVKKVKEALRYEQQPVSLSEKIREDSDTELGDMVADTSDGPEVLGIESSKIADVEAWLECLDVREREIVKLRFGLTDGEQRTLEEIGERFDLTRERIRQIEQRAFGKLRHPSNSGSMRVYAGLR